MHNAARVERSGPGDRDGALLEVPAPALGVEAHDIVCEQTVMDRLGESLRQDVPVVALRPRDVDEVREQRIGADGPHDPRREIEVVVVEEDRRRFAFVSSSATTAAAKARLMAR